MESNKCNRNIRYAIFRESNLTKLSEYHVKTKCHTFLRMAL